MNSSFTRWVLGTTFLTSSAFATPYFEAGDAGQSLADAQLIGAGVDVIYGSVDTHSADMFSFDWLGGAFAVDTLGSIADTQLFLFNAAGQGVWANDQAASAVNWSQIIDPALAAGQYFIGISVFDYDPFTSDGSSSLGALFPSSPFTAQLAPWTDLPLDHWQTFSGHSSGAGDYVINFRTPTAVPEPPLLALFGGGLATLAFATRRRRR
jgi:hypothetical protein